MLRGAYTKPVNMYSIGQRVKANRLQRSALQQKHHLREKNSKNYTGLALTNDGAKTGRFYCEKLKKRTSHSWTEGQQ